MNINDMIQNYNEFLNEKLTDKLQGFSNAEQIIENLIQLYKNDEINFSLLMKNCEKYDISLSKNEKIEFLELKIKEHKINISDVSTYNDDFNIELSIDDIFNLFGYDKGFDNMYDFLIYIFDASKKTFENDIIRLKYHNKTIIKIESNTVYMDSILYEILEYYYDIDNEMILNKYVSDIINEYFKTEKSYEVEYL